MLYNIYIYLYIYIYIYIYILIFNIYFMYENIIISKKNTMMTNGKTCPCAHVYLVMKMWT